MGAFSLANLDIAGIEISDAAISYTDQPRQRRYTLSALRLKTGRVHGGDAFPVELEAAIASLSPALTAQVQGAATVATDAVTKSLHLRELKTAAKGRYSPPATGFPLDFDIAATSASLDYEGGPRRLTTAPLKLSIARLQRGNEGQPPVLSAQGTIDLSLSLDLARQRYAATGLKASLEVGGSSLPGTLPQRIELAGDATADLIAGSAALQAVTLSAYGLAASSPGLALEGLASEAPTVTGPLALAPFEPRKVMALLGLPPPKSADASALRAASLSTQMSASRAAVKLDDLALTLDDSHLRGSLAVTGFAPPAFRFKLQADSLDADRYLPPRVLPPPGEALSKKLDVKSLEAPLALLQDLDAEGTLAVGRLQLRGLLLKDAELNLAGSPKAAR